MSNDFLPNLGYPKVIQALKVHGLLHGEFTLSSGASSDIFTDVPRALMTQPAFDECGAILAKLCDTYEATAIGGPETGAIVPVCAALSRRKGLKGFYIKRTFNPAGSSVHRGDLCGAVTSKDRVVMIEDVVTTGGTLQWAIDHLRDVDGIETIAAVAIVDRSEHHLGLSVPFQSLTTLEDLTR